jgi:hypothetical protein
LPVYAGPSTVPAGTTIREKRVTTTLNVSAGGITIERSCIQPVRAALGMPVVQTTDYNTMRPAAGPVVVRDSDIDGSLLDQQGQALMTAFVGVGELTNNYIHHFGSGIALMNTGGSLDALVQGNYVTDLVAWGDPRTNGNHSDAFTVRDFDASQRGARRAVVRNNRFDCDSGADTGAVFLQTYSGRIDNVVLEGNLLEGRGYQLGLNQMNHPYANVQAVNNRFSGTGFGPAYVQGGPGWALWQDNYLYDPAQTDARGTTISQP